MKLVVASDNGQTRQDLACRYSSVDLSAGIGSKPWGFYFSIALHYKDEKTYVEWKKNRFVHVRLKNAKRVEQEFTRAALSFLV